MGRCVPTLLHPRVGEDQAWVLLQMGPRLRGGDKHCLVVRRPRGGGDPSCSRAGYFGWALAFARVTTVFVAKSRLLCPSSIRSALSVVPAEAGIHPKLGVDQRNTLAEAQRRRDAEVRTEWGFVFQLSFILAWARSSLGLASDGPPPPRG